MVITLRELALARSDLRFATMLAKSRMLRAASATTSLGLLRSFTLIGPTSRVSRGAYQADGIVATNLNNVLKKSIIRLAAEVAGTIVRP